MVSMLAFCRRVAGACAVAAFAGLIQLSTVSVPLPESSELRRAVIFFTLSTSTAFPAYGLSMWVESMVRDGFSGRGFRATGLLVTGGAATAGLAFLAMAVGAVSSHLLQPPPPQVSLWVVVLPFLPLFIMLTPIVIGIVLWTTLLETDPRWKNTE